MDKKDIFKNVYENINIINQDKDLLIDATCTNPRIIYF